MGDQIPGIVEILYHYFAAQPDPGSWPEHLRHEPVSGHGLWAFYQGLQLGIQLSVACLEKQ